MEMKTGQSVWRHLLCYGSLENEAFSHVKAVQFFHSDKPDSYYPVYSSFHHIEELKHHQYVVLSKRILSVGTYGRGDQTKNGVLDIDQKAKLYLLPHGNSRLSVAQIELASLACTHPDY
jgi:hypothetical protein